MKMRSNRRCLRTWKHDLELGGENTKWVSKWWVEAALRVIRVVQSFEVGG